MVRRIREFGVRVGTGALILVFLFGLGLIGCKAKTEAPEQQVEVKKGVFDPLKVNKNKKGGSIDKVDHTPPQIIFRGWTADIEGKALASSVIVTIAGKKDQLPVEAKMGLKRSDVAKAHNAPELTNSGWNMTIPESLIGRGKHKLHFYAVLADGTLIPIGGREVEIK